MNTINKIRAEIEAWIKDTDSSQFEKGERFAYNKVLGLLTTVEMSEKRVEFLDTLEKECEKPTTAEGLEEEMEKFIETFGWGKTKHLAEKELISATARHFAEWQKAKMMEGAVEGYVTYGSKGAYVESDWLGTYDVEVFGPNGNKVKIIVVKEEEQ